MMDLTLLYVRFALTFPTCPVDEPKFVMFNFIIGTICLTLELDIR